MRREQQGITGIGFIIIAAFMGLFVFAALQLAPIYLEHIKVASILTDVKGELDGSQPTITSIRTAIGKRLDIESVSGINVTGFKLAKTDAGFQVSVSYESRARYIANIYLVVVFDKSVEIVR